MSKYTHTCQPQPQPRCNERFPYFGPERERERERKREREKGRLIKKDTDVAEIKE